MSGILLFFGTSCSTYRFLEDGKYLVNSNSIVLDTAFHSKDKSDLKYDLSTMVRQKPNVKLLGLFRWRLQLYYITHDPKDTTKITKWVESNFSEPPVIYDEEITRETVQSMTYYLQSKGYFQARGYSELQPKEYTVNVIYNLFPGERFYVDSIQLDSKDTTLLAKVKEADEEAILKKGQPIDLSLYNQEKNRITRHLRNNGYYQFDPSFITPLRTLEADTANHRLGLSYEILPPPLADAHKVFHIGDIHVFPKYTPLLSMDKYLMDSVYNGSHFLTSEKDYGINLKSIDKRIFLKKGDLYRQSEFERTTVQLDKLGIYRIVTVKPVIDSLNPAELDFNIYLSPSKKMYTDSGLELSYSNVTVRNNIGAAVYSNFRHRNLLNNAEQFNLNVRFGQDLVLDTTGARFAQDIRVESELIAPRFVDIFGGWQLLQNLKLITAPQFTHLREITNTSLGVGYNYLKVLDFYSYSLFYINYHHTVFEKNTEYTISQLGINYFNPRPEKLFDEIAAQNPFLNNSFSKQQLFTGFLFRDFGVVHNFKTNRPNDRSSVVARFEQSGFEIATINKIYNAFVNNPVTFELFDTIDFAKYIRFEGEYRLTRELKKENTISFRLGSGIAVPYSSTKDVPYVKQLFVGGPNSIRSWRIRGIGPGGHIDSLSNDVSSNIPAYQTGDFKLEFSLEYRFPLISYFKGAVFLDGGNIWNLELDQSRPEGLLTKKFYEQIALGGGFGLRFDASFFIFRLDLAYPLRNPFEDEFGRHWTLYSLSDFDYRKINYNIAIGYPF